MICNALIQGVKNVKSQPGAAKTYDFWVLRFLDADNPDTEIEDCSIELKDVQHLSGLRGKVIPIHVHKSGKYMTFGGLVQQKAA